MKLTSGILLVVTTLSSMAHAGGFVICSSTEGKIGYSVHTAAKEINELIAQAQIKGYGRVSEPSMYRDANDNATICVTLSPAPIQDSKVICGSTEGKSGYSIYTAAKDLNSKIASAQVEGYKDFSSPAQYRDTNDNPTVCVTAAKK